MVQIDLMVFKIFLLYKAVFHDFYHSYYRNISKKKKFSYNIVNQFSSKTLCWREYSFELLKKKNLFYIKPIRVKYTRYTPMILL